MHHTPLGVVVILAAALVCLTLFNNYKDAQQAYQTAKEEYEETKGVSPPGSTLSDSESTDYSSYREEWRAEYDLEAQREMARTSWWMTAATWIGVALLLATLYETAQATRGAAAAAEAAQRQADISERALRGVERPYLFVEIGEVNSRWQSPSGEVMPPGPATRGIRLHYFIVNHGKTPAILRSISISLRYNPDFPLISTGAIEEEAYAVIAPGERFIMPNFPNGWRSLDAIDIEPGQRLDAGLLILHGVLTYSDPMDGMHVDSFCMRAARGFKSFHIDESLEPYNWHKTTYTEKIRGHG